MRPPGMPVGIKDVIETSDVPTQTIAKLLPQEARPVQPSGDAPSIVLSSNLD